MYMSMGISTSSGIWVWVSVHLYDGIWIWVSVHLQVYEYGYEYILVWYEYRYICMMVYEYGYQYIFRYMSIGMSTSVWWYMSMGISTSSGIWVLMCIWHVIALSDNWKTFHDKINRQKYYKTYHKSWILKHQ